ncbi:hypothetical protein FRB91_007777 [Serendipita sp. 411]|nr:hypothetical protein FRB91_007777 [Serendipita sp. 411]
MKLMRVKGAGMLSGLNASWSFFMGSVLSWGIIAPSIVKTGQAVGRPIDEENAPGYMSYYSMSFRPQPDGTRPPPSPRYWLLWPGVLMMLVFSFVEIGMSLRHSLRASIKNVGNPWPAFKRIFVKDPNYVPEEDLDPSPLEDRVKTWWWISGVVISVIVSCALMSTQFSMGVYVYLYCETRSSLTADFLQWRNYSCSHFGIYLLVHRRSICW